MQILAEIFILNNERDESPFILFVTKIPYIYRLLEKYLRFFIVILISTLPIGSTAYYF